MLFTFIAFGLVFSFVYKLLPQEAGTCHVACSLTQISIPQIIKVEELSRQMISSDQIADAKIRLEWREREQ